MGCPISVIVPTHNRAKFIARALASVLAQCGPEDEVIVVDDGSTDDTEARLRSFQSRIIYRKVAQGGAGRARNAGLDLARNPLVGFLDSDDEWKPGKLALQRALLERRPDLLFCYSDCEHRSSTGRARRRSGRLPDPAFLGPSAPYSSIAPLPPGQADFLVRVGDLYPWQMRDELVQVGSLVLRRTPQTPRFPEDLSTSEDWEFVGRLARQGPGAYMELVTEVVHRHEDFQLTKLDVSVWIQAHRTILERLWGADHAFLAEHRSSHQSELENLKRLAARAHLLAGRRAQAREELAAMAAPPLSLRALCALPGSVAASAMRLRRGLRRALGASR